MAVLVVGASILAVLVVKTIGNTRGPERRSSTGSAGWDVPATPVEIASVIRGLQDHARALLQRDRAAWVAGVDSAPAAAAFARREQAVFDNLADVRLSTWTYSLSSAVTSTSVLHEAALRWRGRVVILHVQLGYGFAGYDRRPARKDLWLTVVRSKAGWVLASDSDVAASGGVSGLGPWNFGPLITAATPNSLVLAHPGQAPSIATYSALVDHSIPIVTSIWGPAWNDHVVVLIPADAQEFAAVTGQRTDNHDLAAVAIADRVDPDSTVIGARIVLNPETLAQLDANGRTLVIQHELTHLATRAVTSPRAPAWLVEGFADFVGNTGSHEPVATIAGELATAVRGGRVPAALPTTADFNPSSTATDAALDLAAAYEQSWLACRLIASRVGAAGLVRFYRAVNQTLSAPGPTADQAVSAALASVLGLTPAQFTTQWRRYLVGELR